MLTPAQIAALIEATDAANLAAPRPCPDVAAMVADARADPAAARWEVERWDVWDGDGWMAGTVVEHVADAGALIAVVHGDGGERGVVMLSDDRFYPVEGNPNGEAWFFLMGDDHPGFATLSEAVASLNLKD